MRRTTHRNVARRVTHRRTAGDGSILVKVARTGGAVTEYCLDGEKTVEEALGLANISVSKGDRIRVDGKIADLDTKLKNGDIVTVAGKVAGAR